MCQPIQSSPNFGEFGVSTFFALGPLGFLGLPVKECWIIRFFDSPNVRFVIIADIHIISLPMRIENRPGPGKLKDSFLIRKGENVLKV